MTDDGARAARRLRQTTPGLPMILLSQHVETRHSVALVSSGGFGYPLKDRVLRIDDFLDAACWPCSPTCRAEVRVSC